MFDVFARGGLAAIHPLRFLRSIWADPLAIQLNKDFEIRRAHYTLLWSIYQGAAYDNKAAWALYKRDRKLYREIRQIYNPVAELVDFWSAQVYPGLLMPPDDEQDERVATAMPLPTSTPPEIVTGCQQLWKWSNWQANKSVYIRFGATTGNVLVEVIDDLESHQVRFEVVWPGLVRSIRLDGAGNVVFYSIEYRVDPDNPRQTPYTYRKDVSKTEYRYWKNTMGWDYGANGGAGAPSGGQDGHVEPNPYGFVPAVWARHLQMGAVWGQSAFQKSITVLDELNSKGSQVSDQVSKALAAPVVFWGAGLKTLEEEQQKRPSTAREEEDEEIRRQPIDKPGSPDVRESQMYLTGQTGGRADTLLGQFDGTSALAFMETLEDSFERRHPEVTLWRQMREMSQLTGPAAERLMGDVKNRMQEPVANYDLTTVRLHQMALAIAGMRVNDGSWGLTSEMTDEQLVFAAFDLDSYHANQLEFSILPRPLIPPTREERLVEEQTEASVLQTYVQGAGLSLVDAAEMRLHWPKDQVARLQKAEAEAQAQQEKMLAAVAAGGGNNQNDPNANADGGQSR